MNPDAEATAATLQQGATGGVVSLERLVVPAAVPFLAGGIVLFVFEDLFGAHEGISFGVAGVVFLVLAAWVPPTLDLGVAVAMLREFGWRIRFEVGRPLTIYWGLWGVFTLLGSLDEWQERTE